MTTDVLIVGAGPTGLMLANQLGRRGIRATIIDRHNGPAMQTRAMAVQARTLEIYAKLGIAGRAVALGNPSVGINMWTRGKRRARIPLQDMGKDLSPFPYVLMLGQDDNERIMGDHLRHWDMQVRWNTELIALQQSASHVTATIKDPDGSTRQITATYVAGCDGGRSAVREMIVIGQAAPAAESLGCGDMLRVHSIPADETNARALAAVSIAAPSYYLVRPDGYIGLAGARFDESAVTRWLADCHVRLSGATRDAAA